MRWFPKSLKSDRYFSDFYRICKSFFSKVYRNLYFFYFLIFFCMPRFKLLDVYQDCPKLMFSLFIWSFLNENNDTRHQKYLYNKSSPVLGLNSWMLQHQFRFQTNLLILEGKHLIGDIFVQELWWFEFQMFSFRGDHIATWT